MDGKADYIVLLPSLPINRSLRVIMKFNGTKMAFLVSGGIHPTDIGHCDGVQA